MSEIKELKAEDGTTVVDDPETKKTVEDQGQRKPILTAEDKRIDFVRNYYGFIAIGAGLLIGTQTFLYEVIIYTQIDSTTMSLFFANFAGYLTFSIAYHLYEAIVSNEKYGTYWSKEKCSYLTCVETQPLKGYRGVRLLSLPKQKKKVYKVNKFNLYAVMVRFLAAISASLVRLAVIYTESLADLNFSLVSNILALTPFLVAIIFYFAYKESLNKYHIIGIVMIVTCAIMTGISSYSSSTDSTSLPAIVPVMLAILQTCLSALVCLITRYIVMNSKMQVQQIVSDCYFYEGIVYVIIFLCVGFPYSKTIFFCVVGLQMLGLTSVMFLTFAIAYGKAAPSLALNDCSTLYTLLLEVMILGKIPSTLQAIAFFIGLAGALFISFESRRKQEEYSEQMLIDVDDKRQQ